MVLGDCCCFLLQSAICKEFEAGLGLGGDVDEALDEGGVEGTGGIEGCQDGLFIHVYVCHTGFCNIGCIVVKDADDVTVFVVFCFHL